MTSRYRLRARHRPNPRFPKVENLRVPARTACPQIATDGNVRIQCQTQPRIQNARGPWKKVHHRDTLPAGIGTPLSLFFFPMLATELDGLSAKICLQSTHLVLLQSVTCAKFTSVVLACSIVVSPSSLRTRNLTGCPTWATSFSPPRFMNVSMGIRSR